MDWTVHILLSYDGLGLTEVLVIAVISVTVPERRVN